MTRYEELSRKAESLWKAGWNCCDLFFALTIGNKYNELKKTLSGLSIDQSEQSADDRRNHVLSTVGLEIMDRVIYLGVVSIPTGVHSLHDSSTGLPVTWGELIERMNVR